MLATRSLQAHEPPSPSQNVYLCASTFCILHWLHMLKKPVQHGHKPGLRPHFITTKTFISGENRVYSSLLLASPGAGALISLWICMFTGSALVFFYTERRVFLYTARKAGKFPPAPLPCLLERAEMGLSLQSVPSPRAEQRTLALLGAGSMLSEPHISAQKAKCCKSPWGRGALELWWKHPVLCVHVV